MKIMHQYKDISPLFFNLFLLHTKFTNKSTNCTHARMKTWMEQESKNFMEQVRK